MLKFCLTCDTEGFISLKQGHPAWGPFQMLKLRINNLIKHIRYDKNSFRNVYNTVLKNNYPITFMLVGKLFKPLPNSPDFVEWGYHSYSHLPLILVDDDTLKKEVKNIYNCESFCAPMWMTEDAKNPDKIFKELEKEGYKKVIYLGKHFNLITENFRGVYKPKKRGKLTLVHMSYTFEGNSPTRRIKRILKEIEDNIDRDAVYCLSMHDFTHRNTRNLQTIINFTKRLEKEGKLKILNLRDV